MTLPLMQWEREPPLRNIAFDEVAFSDWIDCNEVFQNVSRIVSHILNTTATHKTCRLISEQHSYKVSQGLVLKQAK